MDQAIAKLTSTSPDFDIFFPTIDRIASIVAQKLLRPLNHSYLPNLAANVWPVLQSPFYDVGSQYTVPYTVYTTGIAWRNDKVSDDIPSLGWKSLWDVGSKYQGKVTILDDPRDALYLGMLYDGKTDMNTEDAAVINAALASLQDLNKRAHVKVTIQGYQQMPEGHHLLGQNWSGNLLGGAFYYMPAGVSPSVMSYWAPDTDPPAANDTMAIMAGGKNPVLAHAFLNFMLDDNNAWHNFADFNGYQPPMQSIDASTLQAKLKLPDSLAPAIVTPQQFATAKTACPLTPAGEALWDTAWKTFNAG
jgi:spermidine/putrescine transport system substrate-binding protein